MLIFYFIIYFEKFRLCHRDYLKDKIIKKFSVYPTKAPRLAYSWESQMQVYSAYYSVDFGYKNYFNINTTGRLDNLSTLRKGYNTFFYPSASISSVLSDYLNFGNTLSYLKIRGSFADVKGALTSSTIGSAYMGITGNTLNSGLLRYGSELYTSYDGPTYSNQNGYSNNSYYNGTASVDYSTVIANQNLNPYRRISYETGIDMKFFKNRVGLDATYFRTINGPQIYALGNAPSVGQNFHNINGITTLNQGFEVSLNAAIFKRREGFNWNLSANWSTYRETLKEIADGYNELWLNGYNYKVGDRMDAYYGRAFVRDNQGNNDLYAEATLEPIGVNSADHKFQASSKINPMALGPQEQYDNLKDGIKYKVIVYDSNDNYVTEQDYTSGNEASITGLYSDATYTFVAYTIGSTTEIPIVTYSDSNKKTLSTAMVNNISGDDDLMYFKTTMKINEGENVLDIILKRKFAKVKMSFDISSLALYNLLPISSEVVEKDADYFATLDYDKLIVEDTYKITNMNLLNGDITRSQPTKKYVPYDNYDKKFQDKEVLSYDRTPYNVSTQKESYIYNVDPNQKIKITLSNPYMKVINEDQFTSLEAMHDKIVFDNINLPPGDYLLNLNIMPNNKYYDNYRGYPAVRMHGLVWMRYNLGVEDQNVTTNNPDIDGISKTNENIMGTPYYWGNSTPYVYEQINDPYAWDANSEKKYTFPKKTENDPCPTGWRVPTIYEYQIANSLISFYSDPRSSGHFSEYSDQTLYNIKDNPRIYFTLPYGTGKVKRSVNYLTSNIKKPFNYYVFYSSNYFTIIDNYNDDQIGYIRCIAEYPITKE